MNENAMAQKGDLKSVITSKNNPSDSINKCNTDWLAQFSVSRDELKIQAH